MKDLGPSEPLSLTERLHRTEGEVKGQRVGMYGNGSPRKESARLSPRLLRVWVRLGLALWATWESECDSGIPSHLP